MKSIWQLRDPFFDGGPKHYNIEANGDVFLIDADANGRFVVESNPFNIPIGIFAKFVSLVKDRT